MMQFQVGVMSGGCVEVNHVIEHVGSLINDQQGFTILFHESIQGVIRAIKEEEKIVHDDNHEETDHDPSSITEDIFNLFHERFKTIKITFKDCRPHAIMQMSLADETIYVNKKYCYCGDNTTFRMQSLLAIKLLHEIFHFVVCIINKYLGLKEDRLTPTKCGKSKIPVNGKSITGGDAGSYFEEVFFGYRIIPSSSSSSSSSSSRKDCNPFENPLQGIKMNNIDTTSNCYYVTFDEEKTTLLCKALFNTKSSVDDWQENLRSLKSALLVAEKGKGFSSGNQYLRLVDPVM